MIAFSTCQRGRLKRPSSSSTAAGMWSSTTSILLLFLVLEVAAFQQNFGKIGKTFFCFYVLILLYSSHNTMGLEFDKKKYFFIFKMADEIILLFIQYYKTISKIVEIFLKIIY